MCQTDSFQGDPDFIPRAIKFSAKQLKPICLFKPDFNYYSIIPCPYNYTDVHSAYTKNTGFIYFRKNEHSAKIHVVTEAYRKKRAEDSIWQYKEHSESFLSTPIGPNEIAWKETKKTWITSQEFLPSRILQKEAKIIGMFPI